MATILDRATDLASKVMTRSVRVRSTDQVGPDLHRIELAGDALRDVTSNPGDKVQIRTSGLTFRTYTPIDVTDSAMTLLAFSHGSGPGSELVAQLSVGDELQIFGPRGALSMSKLERSPILVGDETSFAVALAWAASAGDGARDVQHLFEVADPDAMAPVLRSLGLDARLVPSAVGGSPELVDEVAATVAASPEVPLVLTGRAQTIAAIRARLKADGSKPTTLVKAHWDERRAGLD